MVYKILVFLVFLGPLVFFHELGHFLFARLFGVRVETFSLGFGPKLFSFKRGDTTYAVSLIPLGGYVKMFGDDPLSKDKIAEEERKFAYNHKSVWARFWIVFGGPLANFILAFFIYVFLFLNGERITPVRVGEVAPKTPLAELGFRTSDRIVEVNGEPIYSLEDIAILESGQNKIKVENKEDGKVVARTVFAEVNFDEFIEQIFISRSQLRAPVFFNTNGDSVYVSLGSNYLDPAVSLEELVQSQKTSTISSEVYFFSRDEKGKTDKGVKQEDMAPGADLIGYMERLGYYSSDLVIGSIFMNTPADKAGLEKNDIVRTIDGKPIKKFVDLPRILEETKGAAFTLNILRKGETKTLQLKPEEKLVGGKRKYLIGVQSSFVPVQLEKIHRPGLGPIESLKRAATRTRTTMIGIFASIQKLVSAQVSLDSIGGPIMIANAATSYLQVGVSYFIALMAYMSAYLGLINLLPVPVLDGGHIVFLVIELFNRGPLSRKKLEIAQTIGISFIFMLIILALYNDLSRFVSW